MTAMDTRACPVIILDPCGLTQLGVAEALGDAEAGHLLAYLATIPDPRAPTGRWHPLTAIAECVPTVLTISPQVTVS